MKKALHLLLCCCLLVGLAAGCGNSGNDTSTTSSDTSTNTTSNSTTSDSTTNAESSTDQAADAEPVDSNEMEWKLDTSPVTLTAYIDFPQDPFAGWGADPVTAEIARRTGVTIELSTASTYDSQELNLMLSSNDLPDFIIISAGGPMRQMLWDQGFVLPLNKLMDEYAPNMRKVLGEYQESIYTEKDGNFYMMVDYFSDTKKIEPLKGVFKYYPPITLNRFMYEELGSPPIDTIEQFKDLLFMVKEKYPELTCYNLDSFVTSVMDTRNMAYILYRMYGGDNIKVINDDGKVHLGIRDDEYLKAVKFINSLYRDGLYSKENFTFTGEQYGEMIVNQTMFAYWGQAYNAYRNDMTETGPYMPYDVPKIDGITPKLESLITSVGGWHGVHISSTTKHPDRAIRYLEFMQSDEGQLLMNFGIEGEHYVMEENLPKRIGEAKEIAATDWSSFTKDFGLYNYNIQWLASTYTDSLEYYWASKENYAYQVELSLPDYSHDERMNNLIDVPSESEEKVIETKIVELWKTSLPLMYLADSEQACEAAYNEFIKNAEAMGLATLEAGYTANHQEWIEKLK